MSLMSSLDRPSAWEGGGAALDVDMLVWDTLPGVFCSCKSRARVLWSYPLWSSDVAASQALWSTRDQFWARMGMLEP